jgi:hypothetical protein
MVQQATRQLAAAKGTPIRWIVAEEKLADHLRMLFHGNLERIEILQIPARR